MVRLARLRILRETFIGAGLTDNIVVAALMVPSLVWLATWLGFHGPVHGLPDAPRPALAALGVVLVLAQCLPVLSRRRAPVGSSVVVVVAGSAYGVAGYPASPAALALPLVLSELALRRGWAGAAYGSVAAAGSLLLVGVFHSPPPFGETVILLSLDAGAIVGGAALGNIRSRAKQARDEAVLEARRRAMEDRLRLARELHDHVGHLMTAMVIQAGVARHRLRNAPDRVEDAIRGVEESGQEAMVAMHEMLSLLRSESASGALGGSGAWPARLDGIEHLLRPLRAAGIEVSLERDQLVAPLAPLAEATVFRVIEEALTNVLRHSGARAVSISVRSVPGYVIVEVHDDGRGLPPRALPPQEQAHGLIGLTERVRELGGSLDLLDEECAGWGVRARIPTMPTSSAL